MPGHAGQFKTDPLVSVIIPAYNHESYIGPAMESVLGQTLAQLELIVIDDGSTDATCSIARSYQDERIRVFQQANQGTAAAINAGIGLANGRYLAILNSDDIYAPDRLETLVEALRSNSAPKIAFSRVRLIDGQGEPILTGDFAQWLEKAEARFEQSHDLLSSLVRDNFLCSSSNFVFCRELIDDVGEFHQLHFVNDLDFLFRALPDFGYAYCPARLLDYRIHPQNTMRTTREARARFQWECSLVTATLLAGLRNSRPESFDAVLTACLDSQNIILEWVLYACLHGPSSLGAGSIDAITSQPGGGRGFLARVQERQTYLQELEQGKAWLEGEVNILQDDLAWHKDHLNSLQDELAWHKDHLSSEIEARTSLEAELAEAREEAGRKDTVIGDLYKEISQLEDQNEEIWAARMHFSSQLEGVLSSGSYRLGSALAQLRHPRQWPHSAKEIARLLLPDRAVALLQRLKSRDRPSWRALQRLKNKVLSLRGLWDRPTVYRQEPFHGPLVSVVTPCFNHGEHLDDWLTCLQNQTLEDFEILFVDDGSTDSATKEAIDALEHKEVPNLRVIRQANQGVIAARNRAIAEARGKYVFPLDADDTIDKTFLEKCVLFLEHAPPWVFVYTWTLSLGEDSFVWQTHDSDPAALLNENRVGYIVCPKEAFMAIGGYNPVMGEGYEDWELAVNLVKHGWVGKAIPEPLYEYYVRPGSRNDNANDIGASLKKRINDLHAQDILGNLKSLAAKKNSAWRVEAPLINLRPASSDKEYRLVDLVEDHDQPASVLADILAYARMHPEQSILLTIRKGWQPFFDLNRAGNIAAYVPEHTCPNQPASHFFSYLESRYACHRLTAQEISREVQQMEQGGDAGPGILYIAPWVITGGSDQMTLDWFEALSDSPFQTYLATTEPRSNEWLVKVSGWAHEIFDLPALGLSSLEQTKAFVLDYISKRPIRIVHVMNSQKGYELIPVIKQHFPETRIVAQFHCFDYLDDGRRVGYPQDIPKRYDRFIDIYNVVSRNLAQEMRTLFPFIHAKKFRVIHFGLNSHDYRPDLHCQNRDVLEQKKQGLLNVLFIGRLDRQKKPLRMIEAASRLKHEGVPFVVHVLGDGSLQSEARQVRHAIRERNLQQDVLIHGFQPRFRMQDWYRIGDVLLMTSEWEGIPLVLYEAMAMQIPCIAPDVGGISELVTQESGRLVQDCSDIGGYVEALRELCGDDELRKNLGHQARSVVERDFSLERHQQEYIRLYSELLKAEPGEASTQDGLP